MFVLDQAEMALVTHLKNARPREAAATVHVLKALVSVVFVSVVFYTTT